MHCLSCGSANSAANDFCEKCGTALGHNCHVCGHINGRDSRFCGRCGAGFVAADPQSASQRVLQALSNKGGERKRLTVLFADISDSTRLVDSLGDPELGMHRLKPALDVMKDAVQRYEGVVLKMQGDGVMALFGAPTPHEDHAVRGCLAGLDMQEGVKRLNDDDIRIRVGLHSGEVVVQAVEGSLNQTYDATGPTVHLASRLEQMAEGGGVLTTKATYLAAKQFVEAQPIGLQAVRGISGPVEVFKLLRLRSAPASDIFRSGRRLSPLTGRRDQLAALELELARARRGEGGVVGVVGDAGIGKSRLCFEFAENCRREDIRVFETRVLAHGRSTPFQPVLELLRDFFGISKQDDIEEARQRVADRFTSLGASDQLLPVLLAFLGLADPASGAIKLDPRACKMELLDMVRVLARSSPRDTPSVVLVEDLHWIDLASMEFIEALADAVVGTTALFVINYRHGFSAPLMQRSHFHEVAMGPLGAADAQALLRDHLGDDPSLGLLSRNIVERAQGNPFFLEELVSSLAERGDLDGEPGAYQLKGGIGAIPLPATVQDVISARIDELDDIAKPVLEIASVIGREVPFAILESVAGMPRPELSEAVWRLVQAQLLYDMPPPGKGLRAFRHPLIQDVTYQSLLHERRRAIHAAVAKAISTIDKDRAEERASLLAYHLERSGETLKAAEQNIRAATWAGANDPSEALRSWKKVHNLLANQPPSKQISYMRMMACGQIVNFGWREGIPIDEATGFFEEARQLAIELGDLRANALIHAAFGRILANGGSADEYVEKIREAKALAERDGSTSVQVTLTAVLCHALRLAGKMTEALDANTQAQARVAEVAEADRKTLGFDVGVWLMAMRGQTLVMLGRGAEARECLDQVLNIPEGQIDITHHVIPSLAYVDLAWSEGDKALAQMHADRAFSLAIRSGSPYLRVYAQACRGVAHLVAGRTGEGADDLQAALRYARSRKAGLENEARILADLAEAHRRRGDLQAAAACVEEAIAVAVARHNRLSECFARLVAAAIFSNGNADERGSTAQEIERAQRLMMQTGAMIYARLLAQIAREHSPGQDEPRGSTGSGAA